MAPALVVGRGAENGTDSDNAFSASLVNTENARLSLNVWNVRDQTEGWQLHGDLDISVIKGTPTIKTTACIEIPGAARWDCMVAIVDKLDTDTVTLALVDQHMYGPTNVLVLENEDKLTPSQQWIRGPGKITAEC